MFHSLYYFLMFDECKEKFEIVFCSFSRIQNLALSFSSNLPVKLICWEKFVLTCLDISMPISFQSYNRCFLTFWLVFYMILVCFYGLVKKWVIGKIFDFHEWHVILFLVKLLLPTLKERLDKILILVNVGLIIWSRSSFFSCVVI